MKIKIYNVPGYSHEYSVSETHTEELENGKTVCDYRLGINKHLILTKRDNEVLRVEFDNGTKKVALPKTWYKLID